MHRRALRLAAFLPALLLLLSACVPQPTADARLVATLLTDGTGVVHNGRPAASGERLEAGDWVLTGVVGSALVEFSDGTRVQIAEAKKPVYLYWSGATLSIRD